MTKLFLFITYQSFMDFISLFHLISYILQGCVSDVVINQGKRGDDNRHDE